MTQRMTEVAKFSWDESTRIEWAISWYERKIQATTYAGRTPSSMTSCEKSSISIRPRPLPSCISLWSIASRTADHLQSKVDQTLRSTAALLTHCTLLAGSPEEGSRCESIGRLWSGSFPAICPDEQYHVRAPGKVLSWTAVVRSQHASKMK